MTDDPFISKKVFKDKHSYGDIKVIGTGVVRIGKFCSIAGDVTAVTVGHQSAWVSTFPFSARNIRGEFPEGKKVKGHPTVADIVIHHDVWIGQNVTLIAPVEICSGAVIGAGSVVRGNVCPYAVYSGNPAKWSRNRFTPAQIKTLLEIAWWDWSDEQINESVYLLCSPNIQEFLNAYSKTQAQ